VRWFSEPVRRTSEVVQRHLPRGIACRGLLTRI
jgi:hypothetical protein